MQWLRKLFSNFSRKKKTGWDGLEYTQKSSTAGDDFRERNNV